VRRLHDQLAKRLLQQTFEGTGTLTTEEEISPDAQRFDGYFIPGPGLAARTEDLLYRLGADPCAFEIFRDAPSTRDAVACVRKLLNARHVFSLADPPRPEPRLWILCAGKPETVLAAFRADPHAAFPPGVYEGPPAFASGFVVLSQLPATRDTLILRLMGTGATRRRALEELVALPQDARERRIAEPVLLRLRIDIDARPAQSEDKEEMENMDIIQELTDQGREQGRKETLLAFYRARFGAIPPEVRSAVESAEEARLIAFVELFATKSAAEILAALSPAS
jgi:hypothetical protein